MNQKLDKRDARRALSGPDGSGEMVPANDARPAGRAPNVPGHEEAAQGFAAIGSEPRLEVLLCLVRAGPSGLAVGDIQRRLDLPASTLTHHLRFLAAAGLIEQHKTGRSIRNRASFERIEELAAYLLRECCAETGRETADDEREEGTSK